MEGDPKLLIAAQKASAGSEDAFLEVCGILKERLYKTAVGILHDEELALEAVSEAVCKAYTSIKRLKQPQYVTTWFIRILLNICNDMFRKRRREEIVPEIYDEFTKEKNNTYDYDHVEIEEMLNDLPKDLLQIVSLKYFSDFTLVEIAEILSIPEGTVKSRLNRALKHLRKYAFHKDGGGK